MKKLLSLALIGSMASTVAFGAKKESYKIGVTIYKYDDNFMSFVRKNIETEAKKISGVSLLMNDSQNDQSKQNDQVDVMIAKKVNVLAINLVDPAAAPTVIAKANKAKIPVVFFNKEPNAEALAGCEKCVYVGTESKEAGIIQGELMVKHWKANPKWDLNGDGTLQFVYFKGEPGHPDAEARYEYSVKTLNEKGIKTQELHMDTGMWDAAIAKDKMDAWLSGPNKDKIEMVICGNDGMALGVVEALRAANKMHIPVFGVDALPEVIDKIEKGEIAGTVLNDAPNQGKATLDLAVNYAKGKEPTDGTNWKLVNKAVRVPYVGVDAENLKQYK